MSSSSIHATAMPFKKLRPGTGSTGLLSLIPLVKDRRMLLALTILSGLLAQFGTVASVAIGAWIAGMAATGAAPSSLVPGFWMLCASVLLGAGGRWWQAQVSHDFAFALIETLQVGIYDGLERAAPGNVHGQRTGELAAIATSDAELMEMFYAHMLGDVVGAVTVPLVALIVLTTLQPLTALALLAFVPMLASAPFWLARRAAEQGQSLMEALGKLNAEVVEGIQGQRELAIFGRGAAWLKGMAAHTRALSAHQRRYGSRSGVEQAAIDLLLAMAVLTAALIGVFLIGRGSLPPSHFALTIVLAGASLLPITEITQTARKLGELRAGAARILAIFHQRAHVSDTGQTNAPVEASLQFEHVGFSYDGERGAVLHDLTFTVRPGEMVALVGASGAGKSTCAHLALRFWEPNTGHVRIGGIDVRDLPLITLRRLIATVPQDIHLFKESIADNIRLGRPDASLDEVKEAARLAQAHDFITALPQGYDTICGERGERLSGGQRQRISIARAFLCKAPVLLMDEAVSSLDSENELALQAVMQRLRQGRTVLVIAHRPSTIRGADRIVVLNEGRIAEEGLHEELLARGGAYARLLDTT